jgi:hypothetical protein
LTIINSLDSIQKTKAIFLFDDMSRYDWNYIATGADVQLTSFKDHPVRYLSRSKSDALCFSWNGEIYTLKEGNKPTKVMVQINADFRGNEEKIVSVNGGATEMALSPNGKEMAFVFRGEVFVTFNRYSHDCLLWSQRKPTFRKLTIRTRYKCCYTIRRNFKRNRCSVKSWCCRVDEKEVNCIKY